VPTFFVFVEGALVLFTLFVFVGEVLILFTLFVFVGGAPVLCTLFVFVEELMSCLCYLYLLAHSGVQHILCVCFVCFSHVHPVFPVSQIVQL
jgi:hypothetical protein